MQAGKRKIDEKVSGFDQDEQLRFDCSDQCNCFDQHGERFEQIRF